MTYFTAFLVFPLLMWLVASQLFAFDSSLLCVI